MARDSRFGVGADVDGKLFGAEPDARLGRPFLWIQSGGTQTAEYADGRDRFLGRQGADGTLLTVEGSTHLGFTDDPSSLSAVGRALVGPRLGIGSISLADMTSMTGTAIAAFAGRAFGVGREPTLGAVAVGYPGIRLARPRPSSGTPR